MKLSNAILACVALTSIDSHVAHARYISMFRDGAGDHRGVRSGGKKLLKLKVTNLTYQQIFSPFFVMVHNAGASPLYTMGAQAPHNGLRQLAEDGNPENLVDFYADEGDARVVPGTDAPLAPGESTIIKVEVDEENPLVSIASMAISTNDCFVAINGAYLSPGDSNDYPGLDSGTEENTENCKDLPGPPCVNGKNRRRTHQAEGFVHVHRGIHGIADLDETGRDWRNPMMRVEVQEE